MLRKKELLKELGTVDFTPRNIKGKEVIEFVCHTEDCGAKGLKRFDKAVVSYRHNGWAYQCDQCRFEKSAATRAKHYTQEYLQSLGAVDTTPRTIKARDWVFFKCKCGSEGDMIWYDAQRNIQRNGHVYQCRGCLSIKIKNKYSK